MNDNIIKEISNDINVDTKQIMVTLEMLQEGNTIPFIARYRKEKTGGLTEEQIKVIGDAYEYQVNLLKRKEDVIRLIDEKGLLTDELKKQIMDASKLIEVEDLYRPYKEKKKTKATEAIKNGLEPLAKMIMSCPLNGDINKMAEKFINENVKSLTDAITGAKYIIAEWISDNASYRKYIRSNMYKFGTLVTKVKKDANDENKVYEMYYDYSEAVSKVKPHRILAINRAEKENIINVKIEVDNDRILEYLKKKNIKNDKSFCAPYIEEAVEDSFKRLIFPSVQREVRGDLTEKGMDSAIDNFGKNLESLLLTPPMKE